jgi:hypothetical protein
MLNDAQLQGTDLEGQGVLEVLITRQARNWSLGDPT